MSIKEEIFEEFLKKLDEDKDFPKNMIKDLKKIIYTEKIESIDQLFNIVKAGCKTDCKN